jgi:hypothetical protein
MISIALKVLVKHYVNQYIHMQLIISMNKLYMIIFQGLLTVIYKLKNIHIYYDCWHCKTFLSVS